MFLLFLLPLLVSVEYRIELGALSVAVCELAPVAAVAALIVGGVRQLHSERGVLLLLLSSAFLAFIGVYVAEDQVHALSVYRDLLSPLLLFLAVAMIDMDRQRLISLAKVFTLFAAATSALGLVQYFTDGYLWTLTPDGRTWQEFKTGLIRSFFLGRWLHTSHTLPIGLTAHTMNFAAYLVLPALVARALGWLPSSEPRLRWLWRSAFYVMFVTLLLTFARSSVFTLIVGWTMLWAFKAKRDVSWWRVGVMAGVSGLLVLTVILSGVVSFDALGTLRGRGTLIESGLALIRDHPDVLLTGGYTDIYRSRYHGTQLPHNLLVYLVIQYGVPATLAWGTIAVIAVRRTFLALRTADQTLRGIALAVLAGSVATLFMYAQTTSFIDTIQTGAWFFFWLGLGVQIHRLSQAPESAPARDPTRGRLPLDGLPSPATGG